MVFDLNKLVRESVKHLTPYSSARGEFSGRALIFLDANENSCGSPLSKDYSRYPDPLQSAIKKRVAELNGVQPSEIFVGNGSDEAIDLLFRIFCRPGTDNVVICPPTYGIYEVVAGINDVEVRRANLTTGFELDSAAVRRSVDENTKLIFLCSPNNPTGNALGHKVILDVAESFDAIVVVDEAYIHFSNRPSLVGEINNYPNLVVLQTFSKAWGLAGLRVGLAFANAETIKLFNKIKPPYNVGQNSQELILTALERWPEVEGTIAEIVRQRELLANQLLKFSFVARVYPSDANFLLVKTLGANNVYKHLLDERIVVRNRSNVELCEECLRITIGTPEENRALMSALSKYETSLIH